MASIDYVQTVKKALEAIEPGHAELEKYFHENASVFLPGSDYRLDTAAALDHETRHVFNDGAKIQSVHIHQPVVLGGDDSNIAAVSFHFVGRVFMHGALVPINGGGTAVFLGDKVQHLHLSTSNRPG